MKYPKCVQDNPHPNVSKAPQQTHFCHCVLRASPIAKIYLHYSHCLDLQRYSALENAADGVLDEKAGNCMKNFYYF